MLFNQWHDRVNQEVFEYELENGDRIKAIAMKVLLRT
jgi:hypothetical protein